MKKIHFFQIIILSVIVFVSVGCKKESPATGSGSLPVDPPSNRPPVANAGVGFSIVILNNEMTLRGQATDPDMGNTLSTTWTKIAGPACTIVSPQNLVTNVSNLHEGVYHFELLVSDNYGLTSRDTAIVRAVNIGSLTNPVIFFNLSWICPMGCRISVPDIYSHIPSNTPIRVFIKFINQAVWHEVAPISQYSLGNLYYYGFDIDHNNTTFWLYADYGENNIDVRIFF